MKCELISLYYKGKRSKRQGKKKEEKERNGYFFTETHGQTKGRKI